MMWDSHIAHTIAYHTLLSFKLQVQTSLELFWASSQEFTTAAIKQLVCKIQNKQHITGQSHKLPIPFMLSLDHDIISLFRSKWFKFLKMNKLILNRFENIIENEALDP